MVDDLFTADDPDFLLKAARTLRASKLFVGVAGGEAGAVKRRLVDAAREVSDWSVRDPQAADGVVALCGHAADPAFSKALLERVAADVASHHAAPDGKSVSPEATVKVVANLCQELEAAGHGSQLPERFVLGRDVRFWLECCQALERHESLWGRCAPGVAPKEIVEALKASVTEGRFGEAERAAVKVTEEPVEWAQVAQSIRQRLDVSQPDIGLEGLVSLLKGLAEMEVRDTKAVRVVLTELATGGHLAHQFPKVRKASPGLCLYLASIVDPKLPPPQAVGNATQGHQQMLQVLDSDEVGPAFAGHILDYREPGLVFKLAVSHGWSKPLIRSCLVACMHADDAAYVFTPEQMRTHWKDMGAALESDEGGVASVDALLGNWCPTRSGWRDSRALSTDSTSRWDRCATGW